MILIEGGLARVLGDSYGTGHFFAPGELVRTVSSARASDERTEWTCVSARSDGEYVVHESDLEGLDIGKLTVVPGLPDGQRIMGDPSLLQQLPGNPKIIGRPVSETGGAKDQKLADYAGIPSYSLHLLAERFGIGAQKYEVPAGELDNWRNGYPWSLSYSALQRHLNAFWRGEDIDAETGQPHLAAVAWHAFVLLEWSRHPALVAKYDDRQDPRTGGIA